MTSIAFLLFAGTCVALLMAAVLKPERIYQFPYFMAAAFGGFVLPQAYGIYVSGAFVEDWKTKLFLQSFLLVGACWVGYQRAPKGELVQRMRINVNPGRFALAGIGLTVFGYYFDYKITLLPPEMTQSQGTGIFTIYLFFAAQMYTGFAICIYSALIYRKRIFWIMAGLGSGTPLVAVLVYGRREPAALMLLTMAMVLYFAKKITPPSWLIAGMLVLGTMLVPATEAFRNAQARGADRFAALTEVNYGELFASYSNPETISEVKNAMYVIEATSSTGIYGYGQTYWNKIIFGFVPAQIVGRGIKEGLMIGDRQKDPNSITQLKGYTVPNGSTITCIGDTFQQFGYFGCLFYMLVAMFYRNLWVTVNAFENPIMRIFYIQTMVGSMRSVSHGSGALLPAMIYSGMFLFMVTIFARVRAREK